MADPTPTREQVVTANIAAVKAVHGDDAYLAIIAKCAQDMSISLAQLVDNTPSS